MRFLFPSLCVGALLVAPLPAAELLPANTPVEKAVDHYINARLKEENVTPAPLVDDAGYLRRATLDLVGRIPTRGEYDTYTGGSAADKRTALVDQLMKSPAFNRHLAQELDTLLMDGTRASVRPYLQNALVANKSWEQIYKELLLPDESDPQRKGTGEFLRVRANDADRLTADVSSIFFGVNVSCAQCHDHPHVHDWKQDHFYGMKSFLARTVDNGGALAERDFGLVKFKTTKNVEKQAKLMFLTGKVIDSPTVREPTADEARKEKDRLEAAKKTKTLSPATSFSARAELVKLSLQPGERDFMARAIVNRTWYRLFGMGLVNPVDQMHSENPPTHPELLEWLARDLVDHGWDLRRLIRGLVLSQTYARASKWDGDDPPKPALFAMARVRALTPMQLAMSLRVATADPTSFPAAMKADELDKRMEGLEGAARGFASLIEQPRDNFQIGVSEALLFSNSDRIAKDLLTDGTDRLVGRMKVTAARDEAIRTAVLTVLCRLATEEEVRAFDDYLQKRTDRPVDGYRQVVWALLTCSEFRFNH